MLLPVACFAVWLGANWVVLSTAQGERIAVLLPLRGCGFEVKVTGCTSMAQVQILLAHALAGEDAGIVTPPSGTPMMASPCCTLQPSNMQPWPQVAQWQCLLAMGHKC